MAGLMPAVLMVVMPDLVVLEVPEVSDYGQ